MGIVETAAIAIGSAILGGIFLGGDDDSKRVGSESRYDPQTAKAEQTMRINQTLSDLRQKMEQESRKVEDKSLRVTRKAIDDLMTELKRINGQEYAGRKLNLNLERLQRENEKTEKAVHGCFSNYMAKRISLDDRECVSILEMEAGPNKEQRMKDFITKVSKESLQEIGSQVKNSLTEQMDNIRTIVEERLQLVDSDAQEKVREYEAISKNKDENIPAWEENLLAARTIASFCTMGEQLTKSGKTA